MSDIADRIAESRRVRAKWPGKLPLVFTKASHSSLPELRKRKFLCPSHYTFQQLMQWVRKKLHVPRDRALFIFANGSELLAGDTSVSALYHQKKDDDGFLYLVYSDQEVMG